MPLSTLSILPMAAAHLEAAARLSAAVGWPHRVADWAFALELGYGMVALDGGAVVGSLIWWPFGAHHATLGLIAVEPSRQGQGLGSRLMEAALAQTGSRTVSLNATREGQPLYVKMGFRPSGAIRQHQGIPQATKAAELPSGTSLRALHEDDLDSIVALDAQASGLPRTALLGALSRVGAGLVLESAGEVRGYAFCRRFGRGQVIGPVVAPDEDAAKALIEAWIARHDAHFLRVDVPAATGLSGWLEARGLLAAGDVVTMTRGTPLTMGPEAPHLFALASQALG